MKTQIRAAKKTRWSLLPIAPFEFESFEIPVRRFDNNGPLSIGAVFRTMNVDTDSGLFNPSLTPIDIAQSAKIFLPPHSAHGLEQALPSDSGTSCSRPRSQKGARARVKRLFTLQPK